MTRRAHPQKAVSLAYELRGQGLSYQRIAQLIYSRLGISVGQSTVRDWVTYGSRL